MWAFTVLILGLGISSDLVIGFDPDSDYDFKYVYICNKIYYLYYLIILSFIDTNKYMHIILSGDVSWL